MEENEMVFAQGYRMMYRYLDSLWDQTHDDTLGDLLSGMSWGTPATPCSIADWENAVGLAMHSSGTSEFGPDFAYRAMIWFLEIWLSVGWRIPVAEVHDQKLWAKVVNGDHDPAWPALFEGGYQDSICGVVFDAVEQKHLSLWTEAVQKVLEGTDDPYLHFV